MDNTNDVIELLDILYGMVNEAWGVPLGNDKCIIEREKAIEIINEIKDSLPNELAEAKRLVAARDEFIGNAKREAEAMRKSAEEKARAMVEEQEVMRTARARSTEMINSAEAQRFRGRHDAPGRREPADLHDRAAARPQFFPLPVHRRGAAPERREGR